MSRGEPLISSPEIESSAEPSVVLTAKPHGGFGKDIVQRTDCSQPTQQPPATLTSEIDLLIPEFDGSTEASYLTSSAFSHPTDWPWIHENLFLQSDSSFDLGLLDSNGITDATNNVLQVGSDPFPHPVDAARSCTSLEVTDDFRSPTTPTAIVIELINFAVNHTTYNEPIESHWHIQSNQVAIAFRFQNEDLPGSSAHWLQHFVNTFMEEFHELWPIFRKTAFDPDALHPILYLTLASIGAMYGSAEQRWFGTMMHEHTRKLLATTLVDLHCSDEELMALAQARLFSQVSALYFGQSMGFSYAQHLGAILVGQVRRVGLLSERKEPKAPLTEDQKLDWWSRVEARKRLALAILRADIYTSVLLNTWPLIPAAELELQFPCPLRVWDINPALPSELQRILIREDETRRFNLPINDTLQNLLEQDTLLLGLGVEEYETIIFTLQQRAWRHRHRGNDTTLSPAKEDMHSSENHGLDEPPRLPADHPPSTTPPDSQHDPLTSLRSSPSSSQTRNRHRLLRALHKWKRAFDTARTSPPPTTRTHRSTVLSALLLYHLTYLRLLAPLSLFQHLSHSLFDAQPADPSHVAEIRAWARTPFWPACAARHACAIVGMLDWETRGQEEGARARFNFLSFAGLHHAAVVLWVYAGTRRGGERCERVRVGGRGEVEVCKWEVEGILAFVTEVHGRLGVARASSFQAASERLGRCEFPVEMGEERGEEGVGRVL